jgi:hypothetical protein
MYQPDKQSKHAGKMEKELLQQQQQQQQHEELASSSVT